MVELDGFMREQAFHRGVKYLQRKLYDKALEEFRSAVACENLQRLNEADPVYLSYYGLCLAQVKRKFDTAIKLCRHAVNASPHYPEVFLNFGTVLELSKKRDLAIDAYREGYRKHTSNTELLAKLQTLSPRGRVVFPFLDRNHLINKISGIVWHKSKQLLVKKR